MSLTQTSAKDQPGLGIGFGSELPAILLGNRMQLRGLAGTFRFSVTG